MIEREGLSLKATNYKCFGDEPTGFDRFAQINLIVGKNNSGKSSLLDLVAYAAAPSNVAEHGNRGKTPVVMCTAPLGAKEVLDVFRDNTSGGELPGSHGEFGRGLVRKRLSWTLVHSGRPEVVECEPHPSGQKAPEAMIAKVASLKTSPFAGHLFFRLVPDRDIRSEDRDQYPEMVDGDGRMATSLIRRFLHEKSLRQHDAKRVLLAELNGILDPDVHVQELDVQENNRSWEIHLREDGKGWIPLSSCGSGLKTVLLVICILNLLPLIQGRKPDSYILGLEEPENNLHPSLQRRLMGYLRDCATSRKCLFFINTHSATIIDCFCSDPEAQVLHVTHDGVSAKVRRVTGYRENKDLLEDLGVRASDLIQANAVVWVEGPSDRVYFNRWIGLWTGGLLREGKHYQCVFYGGRLLAHVTGESDGAADRVRLFTVNRNAIVVMDSDKGEEAELVGKTKQRIESEVSESGGLCWITQGREIENYLPGSAVRKYCGLPEGPGPERFGRMTEFLEALRDGEGERFACDKVGFASGVSAILERAEQERMLDWVERMKSVCGAMAKWNGVTLPEGIG